jgi:hypothetical protein
MSVLAISLILITIQFHHRCPGFASEIAPLPIRGAITAGMNFAVVLVQMIAYGVFRQASFCEGKLQNQVLFAIQ